MPVPLLSPLLASLTLGAESRKISARRKAAGGAWDGHLERSRAFICEALPTSGGTRVVVLGSGPLFDVPVDELCAAFDAVVLVDLYHPKAAKDAAARHGNLELITCDVTSIAKPLKAAVKRGEIWPQPCLPSDLLKDADLVVSLNILSQLCVGPHQFLSQFEAIEDADIQAYCKAIIQSHLDGLRATSTPAIVICDLERQYFKGDTLHSREDLLFGVELPTVEATWDWDIAPAPLDDPVQDLRHKVRAFKI